MTADQTSMFRLDGKAALVTGASSGLGWAFSKMLADAGARVVVAARRADALEALVAEIAASGGEAHAVSMDVADPASVTTALEATQRSVGPIHVLINNAGIARTKSFLDHTEQDWDEVLGTNLLGAWRVAQGVAAQMAAHGEGGSIVHITSLAGIKPGTHMSAYGAAKAALNHLTQTMALELARHKIRVNAIAPGYVETPINAAELENEYFQRLKRQLPLRRLGVPADLEGALLLLATDASRWMTGQTLIIDGGHAMIGA
jgi:NAD(P)-dependent dehydrogenase (short-subunit alcohol dehydrogenase family)